MVNRNIQVEDIRRDWAESDRKRDEGLTTPEDIIRYDDLSYGSHDEWNLLDIYCPKGTEGLLPCIVNIHGGAWVYGNKEIYQFYCMSLAQRGFTVVNPNYRLAPEDPYPAALEDINNVMRFVQEEGKDYHIDVNNLFMVGDSAGAQLASQYLAIYTNPAYEEMFGFKTPGMKVRAVALNCGMYDAKKCAEYGLDAPFLEYVGKKPEERMYRERPVMETLDALANITGDFPPAFIMSAHHDFLLENAEPMYQHLQSKGVECELKIYGSPKQEEIAHVFHVNVRLKEAKECNDEECSFFRRHIQ